ncbi:unnamed protein product [Bursaphelenchus okinawaensis]|uniref:Saposin B-type domain-containing protein n=1 Tax=Bursaphelenchus okinawaensis TaxID=465554 RepID=A0A811JVC2_9BILA|nr:unnamed protein product [Bursaphelenchus okinawaensis]CAG9085659.1 unnamed protein product [Bursaphelenchus okinawaensis]
MKFLVVCVFIIVAGASASQPNPPSPGLVEGASLQCTLCKYTTDYVCSTFMNPYSNTTQKFADTLTTGFKALCHGMLGDGADCCDDGDTVKGNIMQLLVIAGSRVSTICHDFVSDECDEVIPSCVIELRNPLLAFKSTKVSEPSVRMVVEALYKSAPSMNKYCKSEQLIQDILKSQ